MDTSYLSNSFRTPIRKILKAERFKEVETSIAQQAENTGGATKAQVLSIDTPAF